MRSYRNACIRLAAATLAAGIICDGRSVMAGTTTQKNATQPAKKKADSKTRVQEKTPHSKETPADATAPTTKPKPIPTTWSAEKIAEERKICAEILRKTDAIVIPETSFRKGQCGTAAPVRLVAVGTSPQVALSPPAIMTCRLAAAIHRWTTQDLQRLAKKHLKDQVIRIEVMSDYSCRNTYGRKNGKLSEHAYANALDIRGFSTANGKVIRLLSSWGPTARDIAAEKARADELRLAQIEAQRTAKEDETVRAAEQDNKSTDVGRKKSAKQLVVKGTRSLLDVGDTLATAAKTAIIKGTKRQVPMLPLSKRLSQQGHFLRAAHTAACKVFGTTLGPEANNAHRNHFHVDMRARRHSNYCE